MANILIEGFDVIKSSANLALVHDSFTALTPPTFPVGRTFSKNCLQVSSANRNVLRASTSSPANHWAMGIGYSAGNAVQGIFAPNNQMQFLELLDGSTTQVRIVIIPSDSPAHDNQIKLRVESGPFLSAQFLGESDWISVGEGIWRYIEVEAVLHATAGTVSINVDNIEILSLTSLNTARSGTAQADVVEISAGYTAGSPTIKIDDIYVINNDASSGLDASVTGLLGPVNIDSIKVEDIVTGFNDWDNSQATPGDPTLNAVQLQDALTGIDHDGSYVKTSVVGNKELYTMMDPVSASPSNPILSLEFVIAARKGSPGANRSIQFSYQDLAGNNIDFAGSVTISSENPTQYTIAKKSYEINPLSSNPWTDVTLSNAKLGFKLVS